MKNLVLKYADLPMKYRRPLWRVWHWLISRFDKGSTETFLNYGYQPAIESEMPVLNPEDEDQRYSIQLYDRVVFGIDLSAFDMLEVGCGRGGGASYITRYKKPASFNAIDIGPAAIAFAQKHHKVPGLKFKVGIAEELPFADHSFMGVVNVESARCYRDIQGFFNEVYRVLKPGGYFFFTDMMWKGRIDEIRTMLSAEGFVTELEQNINANVVEALERDTQRRKAVIEKDVPAFLRKSFMEFAGASGTDRYNSFHDGSMEYWMFRLRKPLA
jgi:ubiquinone/menaquinone biosynthesis C-methylase UbiE